MKIEPEHTRPQTIAELRRRIETGELLIADVRRQIAAHLDAHKDLNAFITIVKRRAASLTAPPARSGARTASGWPRRGDQRLDEAGSRARAGERPTEGDRGGSRTSTVRCCRISSNEISEAWPEGNAGRHDAIGMGDLDPPRLRGDPVRPGDPPIQVTPSRARKGFEPVTFGLSASRPEGFALPAPLRRKRPHESHIGGPCPGNVGRLFLTIC